MRCVNRVTLKTVSSQDNCLQLSCNRLGPTPGRHHHRPQRHGRSAI